jgi:hypothetical protein
MISEAYDRIVAMSDEQRERLAKSNIAGHERIALSMYEHASGAGRLAVAAATEITDRLEGKVPQRIENTFNIGTLIRQALQEADEEPLLENPAQEETEEILESSSGDE